MSPARVGFFPALYIACTNVSAIATPYMYSWIVRIPLRAYFAMIARYCFTAALLSHSGFCRILQYATARCR